MASENFYENLDLKYPETVVLAANTYPGSVGPFYIPVLTPYQPSSTNKVDRKILKSNNLMNAENNITITNSTISNTLQLKIPEYLGNDAPRDISGRVISGTKFIVVFIGGDINQPKIIGGDW